MIVVRVVGLGLVVRVVVVVDGGSVVGKAVRERH